MLNISKKTENETLTYQLEGRLDSVTSPDLQADMQTELENANELVLDFEKLDYISSAGLRVLLYAHNIMTEKGGMKVTHVNPIIMEIFEVSGFSEELTIE